MRSILPILAMAALLGLACDDDVTGPQMFVAQEPFAISVAASDLSGLQLTGISGNTTLTGTTETDSVRITGVREVGSRESLEDATTRLDALQVEWEISGIAITIRTVQPQDQEGRNYTVHYEVTLPKSFRTHVVTANGDVRVASMENNVTTNLANGTLRLEDILGSLLVTVANGEILCDATLPLNGTFDLSVANGGIDLTIPTDTSAQFEAIVGNGEIRLFNLDLQDLERTSTRVSGRLGSGQGTISLGAGNGTIITKAVAP